MAIDSAEKRKNISGIPLPPLITGVTPNVAKDAQWRSQSSGSYSGLIAGGSPGGGGGGGTTETTGITEITTIT